MRHQNTGFFWRGDVGRHAGMAEECFQYALHYLNHIILALAQIGIFDVIELIEQIF